MWFWTPTDPDVKEKIREAKKDAPLIKAVDASGNGNAERLCIDMMEPRGSVALYRRKPQYRSYLSER